MSLRGLRDPLADSAWKVRLVARPAVMLLDRVAQQYAEAAAVGIVLYRRWATLCP